MVRIGPINYVIEVLCRHCDEKHLKSECEFKPRFGWKCPECGRRCRSKARRSNIYTLHPYIPSKTHVYMPTEIRGNKSRSEYQKRYSKEHPEVKQRFYDKNIHYNMDYQREYRQKYPHYYRDYQREHKLGEKT